MNSRIFVVVLVLGVALGACDEVCRPPVETCRFAVDCPGDRICHDGECREVCILGADECACKAVPPSVLPADLGICP